MPSHAFWKGYLKLSLVTCPVALMPATSNAERVRFHTVNSKTGNRIRSQYVDSVTGKPVADDQEIKGYEVSDGKYVTLEDEELDAVALETTRTIDIEKFVPRDSISDLWLDTPHYLLPNDEVGEDAYVVIRDAMKATGMAGLSRLVLYRRERPVMLTPKDKGIVLWTLHFAGDIRDEDDYFADIKPVKPKADMMKLARSLIGERTVPWEKSLLSDRLQKELLSLIASKKKRKVPAKKAEKESVSKNDGKDDGKVVSIMDALKKSLEKEKTRR